MNTLSQGIANLKNLYNQEFNTYATAQQDIKSNATSRAQYNIDVNDAMAKSIGNTITGALPGITGQVAKSAFDIVSPAIAFGASPGHDITQAIERVDAQFKGASPTIMAEGPTIGDYWSGIKAENIPSTAFYRALGFAQPLAKDLTSSGQSIIDFFNPQYDDEETDGWTTNFPDSLPTGQNIHRPDIRKLMQNQQFKQQQLMNRRKQDMQQKIRQAEVAHAQASANAAAAGQRREGRGGTHMSRSVEQGGLGISQSQAQAVSDANKAAGMSGWNLARGGRASYFDGGLLSLWPR